VYAWQSEYHPAGPEEVDLPRPFGDITARVTSILSIPYGYTVSLWCAGALAVRHLGVPSEIDVVLFALGAVLAFLALALLGRPHLDVEVPMRVPVVVVANAVPVVVALVMVAGALTVVRGTFGFFLASFLATASYVLGLAVFIKLRG
jgi:hypothetical protein